MIQCCRIVIERCASEATLEIWPAPDHLSTIYSCDDHVGSLIPDHPCVVAPIGRGSATETLELLHAHG